VRRLLAAVALAFALAQGAAAQAQGRGGTPGDFDFYVLALSWSPTYCALTGERRNDAQCVAGRNPGFVVHGLWPQYTRGYPSECGAFPRAPTREAMDVAREVYPSEGLARHEWRVHGTCSGSDPAAYFRDVGRARAAVTIPPDLQGGAESAIAPIEVARRFVAANRGLRPDMMSVTCRQGRLEEVRVCLTKDLRDFAACPEVARGNCRAGSMRVGADP
jgi:ribonuclease T2